MRGRAWGWTAALAVLATCALILHRDGLAGGPAFYELDTRLFYFPLATWVGQQLHASNSRCGCQASSPGTRSLPTESWAWRTCRRSRCSWTCPANLAMVWLRVLHVFLAGALTFAFLRALRLQALPALGGALIFAFGSFVSAQMHHENVVRSAVWLPGALLCLELATQRSELSTARDVDRARGAGLCEAALGLHVQPVLMTAMALGMYAVFRALVARQARSGVVAAGELRGRSSWAAWASPPSSGCRSASGRWFRRAAAASTTNSPAPSRLPPANLPSIIFPFFFACRTRPRGGRCGNSGRSSCTSAFRRSR